jgi:hypothetical protein
MAASRRRQVRLSLLALLVSWLRNGNTNTSGFATYPHTANCWSFIHNGDIYLATESEEGETYIDQGLTIQFTDEAAEYEKVQAQRWDATIRLILRAQHAYVGESETVSIAEKIDEALFRSNGKVLIVDYDASPTPISSSDYLSWQLFRRGAWKEEKTLMLPRTKERPRFITEFDQFVMEFVAQYTTPAL